MIVLDTHVWVWWVGSPESLSKSARETIENAIHEKNIYVSSISVWEVALLASVNRLKLNVDVADWVAMNESLPYLSFVPVDNNIAVKAVRLAEPLHKDPADRIIIATAIILGAELVTKDERIRNYPPVKTIW